MKALVAALRGMGGDVVEYNPQEGYVRAVFQSVASADDVEFLFADGDNTVALRAAARNGSMPDFGRNARRLESIRKSLRWDDVFILRNRKRAFGLIESPFDTFGPVPPINNRYESRLYDIAD